MLLFLKLLLAHLFTDFILQPDAWVENRQNKKFRSPYLYLHGLISGLLSYLFVAQWDLLLIIPAITIIHTAIDLWKVCQKGKPEVLFIIDQILHTISILIITILILDNWQPFYQQLISLTNQIKIIGTVVAYIMILWPSGILIKVLTRKWRDEIETNRTKNESLNQAGKWIGYLERFLTLTLILLNQYSAIGFIFAAKSILRLNPMQQTQSRKYTEYILLGTLLSFTITFIIGMFLIYVIGIKK
ncbi:DUF3307 domain-containing protein [Halosquirtibacter xylanolyticus]|uniref:DUF3307 domain-containing protein n=1 Tax=Halosquirtibacter xylanolyticus TaxID=3374599 RepID=UPI0037483C09|nr:DUF3307 domain-containing protein [Prolixibacteraceae bacterium]